MMLKEEGEKQKKPKEMVLYTIKSVLCFFMLLALFSCARKDVQEIQYEVKAEVIGGVKVLTNPDNARDGQVEYRMEEEISIGVEAGDGRNFRIMVLDPAGNYLDSFRLEGFHSGMKIDSKSRLYFQKQRQEQKIDVLNEFREIDITTQIFCLDRFGDQPRLLGEFPGEKRVVKMMSESSSMTLSGYHTVVWTVDSRGRLFAGLNDSYQLSVYSSEAKLLYRFGRKHEFVENEKYKGLIGQKKFLPAFKRNILFDENGNLWVEPYTKETEKIIYDVFSPEGIFVKQAILPHRVYQFRNHKAYSIIRPEEGFPMVKRFRLERVL